MIAVINSAVANIGSVVSAFGRLEVPVQVAVGPGDLDKASGIVLPGVGAFADGMDSLRRLGLVESLLDFARSGRPVLGICLGMQLLADESEEFGLHRGLGLVPGRVRRLAPVDPGERVPNMGWCDVRQTRPSDLFAGVEDGASLYFVHSYHLECARSCDCVGAIAFGAGEVCVAVARDRVWGVQFHPEKSQDAGLEILNNFARLARS
ncbi:imidazole glycerol phosphate synthase subunit HisH [Fundidesulfovibrio butyratiphilus]